MPHLSSTAPAAATYVTAYPAGQALPTASNLNLTPGQTAPNLVIVKVGTGGKISLNKAERSTHLMGDIGGWMHTN